jgi:hypothetical protein
MNGAADSFLAMSPATSPLLDCRFLGGILYACVAMVQLSGLLLLPGPKWADVFLPDLRVNYYLDAVIQKLEAMSRLDANPSAQGYSRAFQRLKEWYHHRWGGGASSTIPGLIGEIRDGLLKPAGTAKAVVREAEGEAQGAMLAVLVPRRRRRRRTGTRLWALSVTLTRCIRILAFGLTSSWIESWILDTASSVHCY